MIDIDIVKSQLLFQMRKYDNLYNNYKSHQSNLIITKYLSIIIILHPLIFYN